MKLIQIAFVAMLGITCMAMVATSDTINGSCEVSAQAKEPAPTDT